MRPEPPDSVQRSPQRFRQQRDGIVDCGIDGVDAHLDGINGRLCQSLGFAIANHERVRLDLNAELQRARVFQDFEKVTPHEDFAAAEAQVKDTGVGELAQDIANFRGTVAGSYYDANGVLWSAAAWPTSNTTKRVSITGTKLTVSVGINNGTIEATPIAYLSITRVLP
jgi:hypothetical protein